MNFCSYCSNLMYPRNKHHKLEFFCKNCNNIQTATKPLIVKSVYSAEESTQTKLINYNIILDPTLPVRKGLICPDCNSEGPVYFQTTEESMSLTYVCQNGQCVFHGTLEQYIKTDAY